MESGAFAGGVARLREGRGGRGRGGAAMGGAGRPREGRGGRGYAAVRHSCLSYRKARGDLSIILNLFLRLRFPCFLLLDWNHDLSVDNIFASRSF
jgi:hypothetical protein